MVRLVVQIPCYNEEKNLLATINSLPHQIKNIDEILILVINDGSVDKTLQVAQKSKADEILNLAHVGLAKAFVAGIHKSLSMGADIIVNFDADNQYRAEDIEKLIHPVVTHCADVAIGIRNIPDISSFSKIKKFFQIFGSFVVRLLSGSKIKDIPSGFRAFSREAAQKLKIYNSYTYTAESIFQIEKLKLKIAPVNIQINEQCHRKPKLMKNIYEYVCKQAGIILCAFVFYHPIKALFSSVIAGILCAILPCLIWPNCNFYILWCLIGIIFLLIVPGLIGFIRWDIRRQDKREIGENYE